MSQYHPISNSWVRFHQNPRGVIQFIGGALAGSFPTLFYRSLLQDLFQSGFTIVVFPFRFTFRHWSVAFSLLEEQKTIRRRLGKIARDSNLDTEAIAIYEERTQYHWLGHSLGCKYIALLELLCETRVIPSRLETSLDRYAGSPLSQLTQSDTGYRSLSYGEYYQQSESILDQISILVAPVIANTQSAIPLPPVAKLIDTLGLGAKPTRQETLRFIEGNDLFNLTGIISFTSDCQAGSLSDPVESESDVRALASILKERALLPAQDLEGGHGRPWSNRTSEIAKVAIQQIDNLKQRRTL